MYKNQADSDYENVVYFNQNKHIRFIS
jgi:hypothetical protein